MPNTKIVATLGPSSDSPEVIRGLFQAGVDVFRLNASHGTQEDHVKRVKLVREIADEMKIAVGILLDLQGPKIRLGRFEGGRAHIATGGVFTLTTEEVLGNAEIASTSYVDFAKDVREGDRVLLADGSVELRVLETDGVAAAKLEVVTGGWVGDRKGMNLPGVQVSTPSLTRKDMSDLQMGLEAGIDFVALSFVRRPNDVLRLRLFLEEKDAHVPIVAKIEKPEAWQNLDDILSESDGVMVARGDLGVELALERVPFIQKSIIERARLHGKFVITATQMLESMIENPFPTRAEVSDVANAIYDGTDAVMLSAETSAGKYPVDAARMMDRIAGEAEVSIRSQGYKDPPYKDHPTHAEIVADSAYRAARSAGVAAIVVFTASGFSARLIARYRPPVPIFAFTPSQTTARQLSLIYGVFPFLAQHVKSTDEMMNQMDRTLIESRALKPRDSVVFVAGQPIGRTGSTNLMKLHRLGEAR
ncbi:MAG TPA: pyruvate kinase [Solibacterales bacterium]|nr:pyruvate kinase [Bryobacterales bacterium]